MSTNKKRVQYLLDNDTYKKFKKICDSEERSESKMTERIVKKYIEEYEQKQGRINSAELSNIKTG